ncbi:MAG: quaternary ammonium compound efflux SMR transporter SugE [Pseudomonadota bacterium]
MAWVVLIVAGLFEIAWAVALKHSDGFTKLWPSVFFGITACISFACLAYALKHLPMGTAYAVWTGIGAVGIAIGGMVWFGEAATLLRIACIALIVIGILGLKISASQVA